MKKLSTKTLGAMHREGSREATAALQARAATQPPAKLAKSAAKAARQVTAANRVARRAARQLG